MPVSHYAFRLLALPDQLATVWQEGSFLATRWEEEAAVNLYYMEGGFFAEVYYDQHQDVLMRTRTFTSRKCLEDYTPYIRLDDLEKIKAPAMRAGPLTLASAPGPEPTAPPQMPKRAAERWRPVDILEPHPFGQEQATASFRCPLKWFRYL